MSKQTPTAWGFNNAYTLIYIESVGITLVTRPTFRGSGIARLLKRATLKPTPIRI